MLRRAPTIITLNQDDLDQYEVRRQQRLAERKAAMEAAEIEAQKQAAAEARAAHSKDSRIMGNGR